MSGTIRNPKTVIAVAALAVFLATFNETFLGVAFAPIMNDFEISVSTVQWLATAYMLGAAVMVPVSAFLYRSIPTRRLFLFIVGILVVGSVVGGLAPNFAALLIGRIIQALGTGLLIPVAMNITLDVAPRHKLGAYMGLMGAMVTLGPSVSVVLSGVLLSIADWHILLWFFAGLSVVCFVLGAALLGGVAKLTHPRLDVLSVILISFALFGIFYGLSTIFDGSVIVSLSTIVVGALALAWFAARQNKLEHPLIDLNALRAKPFLVGVILNMLALILVFALNILIPVFLQNSFGARPLAAALTLAPAIVLAAVAAPIAGKIYDKHGAKLLLPIGFVLMFAFVFIVSLFISTGNIVLLALLYIPVIVGSGLIIGPVQSFALSRLAPELNAHGVTILSTGFQVAGCIGVSLFSGIFATAAAFAMAPGVSATAAQSQGFRVMCLLLVLVGVAGFALSLCIGRYKAPARIAAAPSILSRIVKRDVYTLHPDDKVLDALRGFVDKKVSGMPVVDDAGKVVGFVSDGDIMRYLADQHTAFKTSYSLIIESGNENFDEKLTQMVRLPVSEIARKHVISVNLDMDLGEICKILVEHHLKKAPVLENGKMVGIINRSNITRYSVNSYLESLAEAATQPGRRPVPKPDGI
ncbi:MAG: MFS transporter [Clostridiales Family XIII bacterium]|nr:MFS transporter [Clostridiales Family XIII bacterium]